jgi:hypothetical protein
VWTPKRILLLAAGFVLFFTAYIVYSHFLGGIDGLSQLPEKYEPSVDESGPVEPQPRAEMIADTKLRLAFGENCKEVKRKNRLELQKGAMVLSIEDFEVLKDGSGKVKLTPFSLAIFGKEKGDGKPPEINTVQSQEAYLKFDEPITNLMEMGKRKIIGGELRGEIYVINNRRTLQRDDDISLFTQGPLYYEEARHLIFTSAEVLLIDPSSKPEPMKIAGKGLDVYLTTEAKPTHPAQPVSHHSKSGSVNGVDRIRLREDVEMNLWVDARSGFLGAGKTTDEKHGGLAEAKAAKPQPVKGQTEEAQPEKAKIVIVTQGPFEYDLSTDRAHFEIAKRNGPSPDVVKVQRHHEREGKLDELYCERLDLQFHRKNAASPPAAAADRSEGLDIETARATGREVLLTSDAEVLEARGTDFFYDKKTHLSTLKGAPMWALKEGNEIEAPELQLLDQKGAQQATALGEGHLSILDKKTGQRPIRASWKKKLIYAKEGGQDLLTLVGDAVFVDDEHKQQLQAQLLKVWFEPAKQGNTPKNDPQRKGPKNDEPRPQPRHVEALGQVRAVSPDMTIHDTDRLVIWFKNLPDAGDSVTAAVPAQANGLSLKAPQEQVAEKPHASGEEKADRPETPPKPHVAEGGRLSPAGTAAPPAQAESTKPKQPIDLSARSVTAHVLVRPGNKNDLDEIWCEGTVRVHQEPTAPDDKGVDIRGDTLKLTHFVDGNILAVTGDQARVQLNTVTIMGPTVNIDQTTNEVSVYGPGIMQMPSEANFDGSKLAQPVDLTISWEERMLFDGQDAQFWGRITAEQDTGHMACQYLRAVMDRKVSLREGDKGKQRAKVQKLLCDKKVWLEDVKRDGRRLVSYKRMECHELNVDNDTETDDTRVNAKGPGKVRIFQLGSKDDNRLGPNRAPQPQPPVHEVRKPNGPPAAKAEEFKLTQVIYQDSMTGNNKRGTATFYKNVVVYHLPTDDPDLKIKEDRLPSGGLYLTCEGRLEVLNQKYPDNTSKQVMWAYDKVYVEGQNFEGQTFSGHADIVKYDESKEQVIFEAKEGNVAVLYQQKVIGDKPEKIIARKIIYKRSTGEFNIEGGLGISIIK